MYGRNVDRIHAFFNFVSDVGGWWAVVHLDERASSTHWTEGWMEANGTEKPLPLTTSNFVTYLPV